MAIHLSRPIAANEKNQGMCTRHNVQHVVLSIGLLPLVSHHVYLYTHMLSVRLENDNWPFYHSQDWVLAMQQTFRVWKYANDQPKIVQMRIVRLRINCAFLRALRHNSSSYRNI